MPPQVIEGDADMGRGSVVLKQRHSSSDADLLRRAELRATVEEQPFPSFFKPLSQRMGMRHTVRAARPTGVADLPIALPALPLGPLAPACRRLCFCRGCLAFAPCVRA